MGADTPTDPGTPAVMPAPWYRQTWVKRLAVALLGGAILASCPFWPKELRAVCSVVGTTLAERSQMDASSSSSSSDGGSP